MIAALEGRECSAARPGRTLPPGKTPVPVLQDLGGPQGRSGRAKNIVPTWIFFYLFMHFNIKHSELYSNC